MRFATATAALLSLAAAASGSDVRAVVGCTSEDDCLALPDTPRCLQAAAAAPPALRCMLDYAYNESGWCACGSQSCVPLTSSNATARLQWLVIGDSISLGLLGALSAAVTATHEVVHAPSFSGSENNDNSHWVARCLRGWLGADPRRWDVVSINAGAHDLAFPDNEHLALPTYSGFLDAALATLTAQLKPSARIVWARITPVPTNPAPACVLIPGRLESSVAQYNAAADAVVARRAPRVASCDLHKVITDYCGAGYAVCNITQCAGPHFSEQGFAMLGSAMAACGRD